MLRPGGSLYAFAKQSDGSLKPATYPSPLPQTSVSLSLVGSWPSPLSQISQSSFTWLLKDEEGTTWTLTSLLNSSTGKYDTARPVSMVRNNGETLTFSYGSNTELTSVTDSFGTAITFDWINGVPATAGNTIPLAISKAHLPGGDTATYVYDSATSPTRLASVEYRDASNVLKDKISYDYGIANLYTWITGIRDKDGVLRWSVDYDNQGRATKSYGPSNAFAYSLCYGTFDTNGNCVESTGATIIRTVTNPLGKRFEYSFPRSSTSINDQKLSTIVAKDSTAVAGGTPASTVSLTYDSNKFIASTTDQEGRITAFTRDANGFPTQIVNASGTALARNTDLTWSSAVKQPTKLERAGQWRDERVYNTAGQLTSRTLTDLRTSTVPYSTLGNQRIWTYSWSAAGRLLSVDGPLSGTSDTTSYTYNTSGYLATVTDPVGLVTTATAWNGRGQPTSVTDPNGIVTTYAYDIQGRVTTITRDSAGTPASWAIYYDAVGNVSKVTQPSSNYLQYSYDNASRLTGIANGAGQAIAYTYDANGNVTDTKFSKSGTQVFEQQATFDDLSRQIKLITGTANTYSATWDKSGLPLTQKDPRNNVVSFGWDALLRLISQTNGDGGIEGRTYNTADNLTAYSDPRTLSTALVRDGFGNILQETSPDRGTTTYLYDARGLRTQRTDARGIVTNYSYDAAGRLTGKTFPASTTENVTYSWDSTAGGNKGKGRLTGMTDRTGTTAWTYDAKGRVTQEVRVIAGYSHTTSYIWNPDNQLTRLTYPSGRVVDYTYDAAGRVSAVTTRMNASAPIVGVAWWAEHMPFGALRGAGLGNDLTWWRTFDLAYRPDMIQLAPSTGTGAALFQQYYPIADGMNLAGVNDALDDSYDVWLNSYDASNRLTSAGLTEGGVFKTYAWTYDKVGNRLTESVTPAGGATTSSTYAYPTTSNRLSGVTQGATTLRSFTYDADGNISGDTRSGTLTGYTYDSENRVRTASVASSLKGTYSYDGMDRLAIRTLTNQTPSGTTHLIAMLGNGGLFDDLMPEAALTGGLGNRIITETDGAGTSLREYIWIEDQVFTVINGANTASPTPYWVTNDQIGRPVQMTDASKAVVWRANYKPFGEPLSVTGSASLDLRFPGQWFQLESGLAWNWHRHYDASLGRYIQPDPLGFAAGTSLYGYAGQSPLMAADPEGRCPLCVVALITAAVAILTPEPANAPGPNDAICAADPASPYLNGALAGSIADTFFGMLPRAAVEAAVDASTPVGRLGREMTVKPGTNSPARIAGTDYSGHALDQMQGRGMVPSVVNNAINNGVPFATRAETTGYYDVANNVRVIVNSSNGNVVTVIPGPP